MSAPQTFPNAQVVSPLDGVKPHQPLTRGQCDLLAIGSTNNRSATFTDKRVADAMFQMFGGTK